MARGGEIEQKRKKSEKTCGHGQQCGDSWGERERRKRVGGIKGDGQETWSDEHTVHYTDDVL